MVATEASTSGSGSPELRNISHQVITGRWFMVFASLLIMAVSGATYMFGSYSNDIKTSLSYDQTTLNLLSFFKDLGANVGVLPGLINEITPPWVVLSIGAVMNFFGYFMIWLAVTGRIAKPQVWQMCLYICIGANSQTFSNTGALVTCVKNFPGSRGSVLGLLKGYVGLSGAIITQLYHAVYVDDSKSLILFIAWIPAAVSIFFLPTIRILNNTRQPNELRVFYNLLYISLGLAGFLMGLIIVQNQLSFTRIDYVSDGIVVLSLLFLPLAVVFREELHLWRAKKQGLIGTSEVAVVAEAPPPMTESTQPQLESSTNTTKPEKESSCLDNVFKPPNRGEDYTILQALFSIDMLVLFTAATFSIGGSLTAIDNLGQIAKSLGYPSKSTSTFVSLVSIWNYLGRVVAGFVSEIFLTKYKFPRPLMLSLIILLSCVGHLLIAFGVPNSLYFSSVIAGFCFGAQWPLIFAIISEIFGLKYYSTLLNMGAMASPLGAYILNVKVTGYFYDKEALKQLQAKGPKMEAGEDLTCIGVHCYKMAFLIITASAVIGCLISLILVIRTRKFYKGDMYSKYRVEAQPGTATPRSGTVSTETESLLGHFQNKRCVD
ncbi:protein NUCLEAR FUSION DEFECTIVE 4-like [Neltuma alba]|uniref:protein NUCLEAR FUSION DEFECTIVE 4-like n=1 Tax=Neltuma alba TaxID=207710 RepID=UPI0010A357F3|nr:protein NUCLEAR FUSION DEFECTIVE 4-like [Prosopis alba]XP_028790190.1 protein NUCLEAR FUSION DEFECTIVE 4-like [Prosopis alba]XP_028790191.1 protein NUCLEAR FUSION DEFECTIVE 4-like [Prosopis alba]